MEFSFYYWFLWVLYSFCLIFQIVFPSLLFDFFFFKEFSFLSDLTVFSFVAFWFRVLLRKLSYLNIIKIIFLCFFQYIYRFGFCLKHEFIWSVFLWLMWVFFFLIDYQFSYHPLLNKPFLFFPFPLIWILIHLFSVLLHNKCYILSFDYGFGHIPSVLSCSALVINLYFLSNPKVILHN